MSELLDIFMPDDLCARCNEEEANPRLYWVATSEDESVRLSFCCHECREAFYTGWDAITRTEE